MGSSRAISHSAHHPGTVSARSECAWVHTGRREALTEARAGEGPYGAAVRFWVRTRQGSCAQHPVTSFPGSPFRVPVKDVVDPSKVKIAGPGLGSGVRARILQSFTVDSSKAGLAPLEVRVLGPRGEDASCAPPPPDIHLPQMGAAVSQSRHFTFEFGRELKIKFLKLLYYSILWLDRRDSCLKSRQTSYLSSSLSPI